MDKVEMIESVGNYLSYFGNVDYKILNAMRNVDRADFLISEFPYEDIPQDIEFGEEMIRPSTVARMLSLLNLKQGNSVLNIGSGSAWLLSLISHIVGSSEVLGLEINDNLRRLSLERANPYGANDRFKIHNKNFLDLKNRYDKIIFGCGILKEDESDIVNWMDGHLKDNGIGLVPYIEGPLLILSKLRGGSLKDYTKEEYCFSPLIM